MRTKILALSLLLCMGIGFAGASVTVEEASSPEDLKRYGFSDKTLESVRLSKCAATGQDCLGDAELKYQNSPKLVRWTRKFFIYLDPALDADPPILHNTKFTPSVNDL